MQVFIYLWNVEGVFFFSGASLVVNRRMIVENDTMADWFKMYENGLSEDRFQYAIHQTPFVLNTWVWILSECCRGKSEVITLTSDYDLKGASFRLNIPDDEIAKCLKLLAAIEYIEYTQDYIKVFNWNKLQSEYCRKKNSGHSPDIVLTLTGDSLPRGEERRGEEKRVSNTYPKEFLEFWEQYPRKIEKKQSFKAYKAAVKRFKTGLDAAKTILLGVERYARACKRDRTDPGFIKHASTWLNNDGWDNDYSVQTLPPTQSTTTIPE